RPRPASASPASSAQASKYHPAPAARVRARRLRFGHGGGLGGHVGAPAVLDLPPPPVGQGRRPDRDEHRRDDEPGHVDVEVGHQVPERAAQVQLAGQHAEQLDGADDERGADRQAGDDQVVVDLADRPGERPAVGEVHEGAVEGVEQHHAAGEQERQRQHGEVGQPLDGGIGRGREQHDLGGGVEADTEDHPDEVQLPGVVDGAHEPAEEPVHQPAGLELRISRNTLKIPASTIRFSTAIRYRNAAETTVPMVPPVLWKAESGLTTAPNTARAATVMPTPTATITVEWPKEKKNPVPSGRFPSAISLRVVLSMQEMWSASNACRNPRNHAVTATPRPMPRPGLPPSPL